MYVPSYAAVPELEQVRAHARSWPFATLVTSGSLGLFATHVPLLVDGDRLIGHLARANPHLVDLDGPALAIFHGPHAFVRSDWYAEPTRQVPTWNYLAVHATGTARTLREPADVLAALAALMAAMQPDGVPPDPGYVEKLAKGVVAIELAVERWEGKAKLSQNKGPEDRERVMAALAERAEDQDLAVLAHMKR
jgi:transcriptional regulator